MPVQDNYRGQKFGYGKDKKEYKDNIYTVSKG